MNQSSKATRGQIWYAEADQSILDKYGHNPNYTKCRPYLIISSDAGNFSSSDVIGLPLTSAVKDLSVHVAIMLNGSASRIICNKPTNLSQDMLESYIATVSPHVLEDVESAMLIALGMSDRYIMREKEVMEMRSLISEYRKIQMMVASMKQNCIDSYKDIASEFIHNPIDLPAVPSASQSGSTSKPSKDNKVSASATTGKKPRIKWTKESMMQFIDDYKNNSAESMMEFYGYSTKKSLQNTYSMMKSKLKKMEDA